MIKNEIEKLLIDRGLPSVCASEAGKYISDKICDLVRECRTRTVLVPCPYCMHNTLSKVIVGECDTTTTTMYCQNCNKELAVTVQTETTVTRIVPKNVPAHCEEQLKLNLRW